MPDEAPVMTATRPLVFSVLTFVFPFALKSWGPASTVAPIGEI
jgi:hypothetical protein